MFLQIGFFKKETGGNKTEHAVHSNAAGPYYSYHNWHTPIYADCTILQNFAIYVAQ